MAGVDGVDWDDLRYFLRAAQAGTLAGAARALAVEHSTVSRRISALEESLGVALLLRGPEGVRLTPLGEALVPLAQEVERAVVALLAVASSTHARARLAVPSGFTSLFTARLAELARKHPNLSLELISGARPVDLSGGEADLAIRAGPVKDKELVARKLCSSGWSLYASRAYLNDHPFDGDFEGHSLVGFDPALSKMAAARWIEENAAGASIVLRSREMTDVLTAAVSGVGLAVLPCLMGDAEDALVRLTPDVLAAHDLSLVYRREARLSETIRAVAAFVADVIGEHAGRISGRDA